jgi:hypothetical protein
LLLYRSRKAKLAASKEACEEAFNHFAITAFPELIKEITQLRTHIRNITKTGVPRTEAQEETNRVSLKGEQLASAEAELLAKAWRQARSRHHPDRGGCPSLFNEAVKAYKDGNLKLLTELALWTSLPDDYWSTQLGLIRVEEQKLEASPMWRIYLQIVSCMRQGSRPSAAVSSLVQEILSEVILNLQTEAINAISPQKTGS